VRYFEENDAVFLNGEYLVKGTAGRILWLILCDTNERGRTSFTNKELRLDPRLGLSALNDNLEARMLLLRRRLEESAVPLRLPATGRGRFAFECDGTITLEKVKTGRV
jgi:adenylate cyclase